MTAAAAMIQSDPAIISQLERLATTQIVVAVALTIVALAALGIALGVLFALRQLTRTINQTMAHMRPRIDPLLSSATRISADAEDIAASVRGRVDDVLETVDDLNERLRAAADSVEDRVRQFGVVVDVVQSEAEGLLLDAASTARGVHSAAQVLRAGGQPEPDADTEEDVFTD